MEESHDEGFSIREYVSRMRSVNVVKCWPFDDESTTTTTTIEESVKSLLPPITVKKFIWWLDALQHFQSDQSVKKVENSKKKKKNTNEKGESSSSVIKTKSWRAKSKKRSILEIFAAAPLVERADTDEEKEKEDIVEEINWDLKGKRKEKKKKEKKTNKNKDAVLNKGKKVVIKKIKKQKKASDRLVSSKENSRMLNLPSDQPKAYESSNSPFKRKKENDHHNNVSIHKKKPRPRHADVDKKTKACKAAFKLTAQNRHNGITPKSGILKRPINAFSQQQQQSAKSISPKGDKRVTFLHEDAALRVGRKPSLSAAECINLHKHCGVVGKDSTTMEYTCPRQLSCMPCEENLNSRKAGVVTSSSSRMTEDFGGSTNSTNPQLCFRDYLETYNQNSAFHVSNFETRLNGVAQTSPHFSPGELLQTACFGPDMYQRGNICATRISDDNFIGLPVNSQGEFIMTSSTDNGHYNQMTKLSTTDDAPCISLLPPNDSVSKCFGESEELTSWECRTSSRDQLNLFVPSRLDMTGSRGNGKMDLDVNFIKRNNNSCRSEKISCKEGKWVQRSRGNEKTLSRMRLMGKEFTVGGFGDGDELRFSNLMMHDQNDSSFGNLRETLHVPSESTIHHSSSQSAKILPQYYDCPQSYMHQNGFVTRVHHNEPLSHAPRSAIKFPFMHHNLDHRREFSPFFDVSEKGTLLMSNLQPFNYLNNCHNHCTDSSPSYAKAEDFCSYNPYPFASILRSNVGPSYSPPTSLLTPQAPTLCYPDTVPISSLQKRNQNGNKIKSRIGIRSVGQVTTFANFGDVQNDEMVSGSWIDSNNPIAATTADFVFSEPDYSAKINNIRQDPAPMFRL